MDESGAVRLFLDHVIGLGHRSVAIIDGRPEVDTVHRRVSAARRMCAARGIRLTVRHAAPTEEGGWQAATRMLRNDAGPHRLRRRQPQPAVRRDGRAAGRGRRRARNQMSLVSFDEDECLAFLDVPVTSVSMPLAELGGAAVDALIARVEGSPAGDVLVRQPMNLQLRGSVSRPAVRPAATGASG